MLEILIAQIDFVTLLPFAAFTAVAIGAWVAVDFFFNNTSKSDERLQRMKSRALGKPDLQDSGKLNATEGLTKLLEKASPALGDALKPKTESEINKQKERLSSAGFRSDNATTLFNTLKVIMAIVGFMIGGGLNLVWYGFTLKAIMYTGAFTGAFLFLPEFVLNFLASSRKEKIFLGLPDALDLMVVCVEAGLGLDQAMRKVSDELASAHPVISEEFNICNRQLQLGQNREEVLSELGDRNGVDDLKTLTSIMIQVDRFGTSIGQALRTQSDTMRTRRRQIAEEKAAKTAVKLIFPLVIFIFPGIFVVLVGPAAITMVREMLPTLGGR